MAFGGKVGDAWVEIHTRGNPRNEADIERFARAEGNAYSERFMDEVDQTIEKRLRKSRSEIVRSVVERDFQSLTRALGTNATQTVERFNRLVKEQGKSWRISASEASNLQRIVREMGEREERFADQRRMWSEANIRQMAERARYLQDETKALRDQQRLGAAMARDTEQRIRASQRQAEIARQMAERLEIERRRSQEQGSILDGFLGRDDLFELQGRLRRAGFSMNQLRDRLYDMRDAGEVSSRDFRRAIRRMTATIDTDMFRSTRTLDRFAGGIGRMDRYVGQVDITSRRFSRIVGRITGRGSRNNFLNFIGTVNEFAASVAAFPVRVLHGLTSGLGSMISTFARFRGSGMSNLASGLAALGPLALNAAALIGGLVIALISLSTIVPAIISGITLLAGALTVLVGALTVGILGGILTILPLLPALAIGLGGAALVAKAFADNSEDAKEALKGFTDVFDDLVQKAEPIMERVIEQVLRLEDEFEGLGDVALLSADRMVDGFARFIDNIESPEMRKFLQQWSETVPEIVGSLANALADFSAGLVAFFAPILPYAEELADNIERAADRFLEWASSTEGQNSISNWMDTAWDAAGKLWNTLVNIGDILGTIFTSATEGAGGDFLGWLEDVTEEWGQFLASEEGQQAMRGFWEDVTEFAGDLKDLISQVIDTWNALDTETARENFDRLLNVVTLILDTIEKWGPAIEAAGKFGAGLSAALLIALQPVLDLVNTIIWSMEFLGLIEDPIEKATKKMEESAKRIGTAVKGLEISPIQVEFDTPSEQEMRSKGDATARAFGETFRRNVEGILTLALTGMVEASPEAIRAEARRMTQTWGDIGTTFADAYTDSLNRQIVEGSSSTVERMTDAQRRMLEAAEIDPEAFARATRASEALATWTSMLVEDMTAAGTAGSGAFGNEFVSGMAGWQSPLSIKALELAAGIGSAFNTGADQAGAVMMEKALTLATGIGTNFGVGLDEVTFQIGVKMANGVIRLTQAAQDMVAGAESQFSTLSGKVLPSVDTTLTGIATRMSTGVSRMAEQASQMVSGTSNRIADLPGAVSSALSPLAGRIAARMSEATAAANRGAANVVSGGANIGGMVARAAAAISGLAGAIGAQMSRALSTAQYYAERIRAVMNSAQSMSAGIGIGIPRTASGGVFVGAQTRIIGEAGPEAVVPLSRPLSQVDPSVRGLSAIAQGAAASGGGLTVSPGAINVHTNVVDPGLVAESILDRIYAAATG